MSDIPVHSFVKSWPWGWKEASLEGHIFCHDLCRGNFKNILFKTTSLWPRYLAYRASRPLLSLFKNWTWDQNWVFGWKHYSGIFNYRTYSIFTLESKGTLKGETYFPRIQLIVWPSFSHYCDLLIYSLVNACTT